MGVGDIGLGKLNIFRLDVAVRRPFFSRREYQWLTIKNRPITVLAKDDVLRESDITQRDPGIAHAVHSFRNLVGIFSIILYAALWNQFAMLSLDANLSPSARVIALDVGGTSVKSALIAPGGHVIGKPSITPIDSSGEADSILSAFAQIIRTHIRESHSFHLLGVALGFPGPFDYAAGICLIEGVEKYGAIYGVNMRDALRIRLDLGDVPILFRNDAEAAVVGEARYGAGQNYRRLIGVTLGTGCGSAFLVGGVPVTSGPGVPPNGWLYPVLFRGLRADDLFSRRGLEARLRAAGVTERNVKDAAAAARAGDADARQVFETFGADLGAFLNPFAVAFAAEAVLVLGRIAGAMDLFGPPLRQALSVPALPGERGPDAALLGAADLLPVRFHSPEGRSP
jgi:glucokinase